MKTIQKKRSIQRSRRIGTLALFLLFSAGALSQSFSGKESGGLCIIPHPQKVYFTGTSFLPGEQVKIILDPGASASDRFAAEELRKDLKRAWGITTFTSDMGSAPVIRLTRRGASAGLGLQGYRLTVREDTVTIRAHGEAGLFYGTQTLLQLIRRGPSAPEIPGVEITDYPDIKIRAVHYDTKHHQDKKNYVKNFIKDLARYKINMLVWEWEDKFAYPSHPEIGAPGAFTLEEMQELTRYARQYHIQIVPLVQGLGHASYILKWPQHAPLREIAASNWEFCPLKKGTYDLLFDLWEDAVKATPGTKYIHIGSDETYELGSCEKCREEARKIGNKGLYQLFVNKAARHLQKTERKVMVWEAPLQWEKGPVAPEEIPPVKGLVLTESYRYNTPDFRYARQARDEGFEVFAYDPNPGTTALFLPYLYRLSEKGEKKPGALHNSYDLLSSAALSGAFDGMICTSWDDAGLHNQMWMLHFVHAAEYAWSGGKPDRQVFLSSFFKNYYGPQVTDMEELFYLLNEGAYYFMSTFERNVWHYGEIGKTHLPDLPRGQIIEYDPYWNTEYKIQVEKANSEKQKMKRAQQIIENDKKLATRHTGDFEIFETIASLIRHTALTYLDLSELEQAVARAHKLTFIDHKQAYEALENGHRIITGNLERRDSVFYHLVTVWGKTRLPKGLSVGGKEYFWQQDRARHFANRRADMSFLIYDEQLLDLEGYLKKLEAYMKYYKDYYRIDQGF